MSRTLNRVSLLHRHHEQPLTRQDTGGPMSEMPNNAPSRLTQVDLLRGVAIVLMALDHVRHFFYAQAFSPTDLEHTTVFLFFTRWVTHLCAPVFFLLAGTGAFLAMAKKGKRATARFLLIRGFFLVCLELLFLRIMWLGPGVDYHSIAVQVIWALGWSMICLAGLLFLPTWMVTGIGVVMVAGHNLLDGLDGHLRESLGVLWGLLHSPGRYEYLPGFHVIIWYSLIPWIGVMAVGYGLAPLFLLEQRARRTWLLRLGMALTLAFVVIRAVNVYGDPQPWSPQPSGVMTFLSFINLEKSPPSLLFLLMTLGPSILFLSVVDRVGDGLLARSLVTIGKVSLLFYIIHLPLIRVLRKLTDVLAHYLPPTWRDVAAQDDAYGLPYIYFVWLLVVLLLFPFCRWLANLKAQRRGTWLSYL